MTKKIDYATASDEDKAKMDAIIDRIDPMDMDAIGSYGNKVLTGIEKFADQLLDMQLKLVDGAVGRHDVTSLRKTGEETMKEAALTATAGKEMLRRYDEELIPKAKDTNTADLLADNRFALEGRLTLLETTTVIERSSIEELKVMEQNAAPTTAAKPQNKNGGPRM